MKKAKYTIVAVSTIDGKIARNSKHNVDWSSVADKLFLKKKIAEHDVVIVGRKTFEVAKKALTKKEFATRRYIVLTRSVKSLEEKSDQVILANLENIDIQRIISKKGYKNICILGGTQIYTLMLKKKLVNDIFLTVEPLIFGSGLNLFDGKLKTNRLKLISVKKLNKEGTILLHYKL